MLHPYKEELHIYYTWYEVIYGRYYMRLNMTKPGSWSYSFKWRVSERQNFDVQVPRAPETRTGIAEVSVDLLKLRQFH